MVLLPSENVAVADHLESRRNQVQYLHGVIFPISSAWKRSYISVTSTLYNLVYSQNCKISITSRDVHRAMLQWSDMLSSSLTTVLGHENTTPLPMIRRKAPANGRLDQLRAKLVRLQILYVWCCKIYNTTTSFRRLSCRKFLHRLNNAWFQEKVENQEQKWYAHTRMQFMQWDRQVDSHKSYNTFGLVKPRHSIYTNDPSEIWWLA